MDAKFERFKDWVRSNLNIKDVPDDPAKIEEMLPKIPYYYTARKYIVELLTGNKKKMAISVNLKIAEAILLMYRSLSSDGPQSVVVKEGELLDEIDYWDFKLKEISGQKHTLASLLIHKTHSQELIEHLVHECGTNNKACSAKKLKFHFILLLKMEALSKQCTVKIFHAACKKGFYSPVVGLGALHNAKFNEVDEIEKAQFRKIKKELNSVVKKQKKQQLAPHLSSTPQAQKSTWENYD